MFWGGDNMGDWISLCCTSHHDDRFHFDDEYKSGICNNCKEHAEFEKEEEK